MGLRSTEIIFHSAPIVKKNLHPEITFIYPFRAMISELGMNDGKRIPLNPGKEQ